MGPRGNTKRKAWWAEALQSVTQQAEGDKVRLNPLLRLYASAIRLCTMPPLRPALWLSPLAVALTTWALFVIQADVARQDHVPHIRPYSSGYLLSVMLLTALGGWRAGALTLALSVACDTYVLETPQWSWRIVNLRNLGESVFLLLVGVCIIFVFDALRRGAGLLRDVSGSAAASALEWQIRQAAVGVPGVRGLGTCRLYARGLDYSVALEIQTGGDLRLRDAQAIARRVEDAVCRANPLIWEALIHVTAAEEDPAAGAEAAPTSRL